MNRRVLITAAACLALVGGWYMLLWSPGRSSMKAAEDRRAAAEQKEATTASKVNALAAAKKNLPAMQTQIDVLRKAIPDTAQLDTVIATIDTAATQSGLDLQSLAPTPLPTGAAAAATPLTELTFNASAKGTYFQIMDFVHRVAGTPRLIVVDNVSLSAEDKGGVQTATFTGRMFMSQKPSAVPATTPTTATGAK